MHRIKLSIFAVAATLGTTMAPAFGGNLEITVGSIKGDTGKVLAALHSEAGAATFPDTKGIVSAQSAQAVPGTIRFVFEDLPAGRYAIAVIHDKNNNGKLDTDFLGMPKEGFGFSQNATGFMGPPSFKKAAINVPADKTTIQTTTEMEY